MSIPDSWVEAIEKVNDEAGPLTDQTQAALTRIALGHKRTKPVETTLAA
jgi:hypothetical protein